MSPIQRALWLSQQALGFMFLPPLALVFAIGAVSFIRTGWKQWPFRAQLWKPYYWCFLMHVLFFAAAIIAGVLFEAAQIPGHSPYPRENQIGTVCVDILLYASFASCAFWVWRMMGLRWFAIA
jgi:hypothetical protein